jgi:hypothetical protein
MDVCMCGGFSMIQWDSLTSEHADCKPFKAEGNGEDYDFSPPHMTISLFGS